MLCNRFGIGAPVPDNMLGSMASIPLPPAAAGSAAARLDSDRLAAWFRERGVRTWLYPHPLPLLRVSAQLYNNIGHFERLADLLEEALRGG